MTEHFWECMELVTTDAMPREQWLHLLACKECRGWLLGRLLEDDNGDETWDETYTAVFEKVSGSGGAAEQRSLAAEALLAELMQAPPKARRRLLASPRFLHLDLLFLLVERSHEAQLSDPAGSEGLAEMAGSLAAALGEDQPDAVAFLPRAFCLAANALRLQGKYQGAEEQLAKAAPLLDTGGERALYGRVAGLVRWETGRREDALALLERSVRLLQVEGPAEEAESCNGVLGIVLFEEGEVPLALPRLHRAWRKMDRDFRPLLAVRIGLALAICYAAAEQGERARRVHQEALKLYLKVTDPREMVRLYGLEGLLLGMLGSCQEAGQILHSVLQQLMAEPSLGDASLAWLDLAAVLLSAGEDEAVRTMAEEVEEILGFEAPAGLVGTDLIKLSAEADQDEASFWAVHAASRAVLRRAVRALGMGLSPLPFV